MAARRPYLGTRKRRDVGDARVEAVGVRGGVEPEVDDLLGVAVAVTVGVGEEDRRAELDLEGVEQTVAVGVGVLVDDRDGRVDVAAEVIE